MNVKIRRFGELLLEKKKRNSLVCRRYIEMHLYRRILYTVVVICMFLRFLEMFMTNFKSV